MCVFAYMCACVCVCVPCESVSAFVRECERVVSLASRIFPPVRMRLRKWAEGGKEKHVWVDLPGFCGSVVCAECLPRVYNVY